MSLLLFSGGNWRTALFKRPGHPGQAGVISHLVKITRAVNAPVVCSECQERRDWQLDGSGSICMAFSRAGDGHAEHKGG